MLEWTPPISATICGERHWISSRGGSLDAIVEVADGGAGVLWFRGLGCLVRGYGASVSTAGVEEYKAGDMMLEVVFAGGLGWSSLEL